MQSSASRCLAGRSVKPMRGLLRGGAMKMEFKRAPDVEATARSTIPGCWDPWYGHAEGLQEARPLAGRLDIDRPLPRTQWTAEPVLEQ